MIKKAIDFAWAAHKGQTRKYGDIPYFTHCKAVADLVRERTDPENPIRDEMIAAAYLHDTVEDTSVRSTDILDEFGPIVWKLVMTLTDKYTPEAYPQFNRATRKEMECQKWTRASKQAKLIKLCDLIDNTKSIVAEDPKFAIVYLREKANLLEAMGFGNE